MDLATVIGLLLGAGLILASIADQLNSFMDGPSVFIVTHRWLDSHFVLVVHVAPRIHLASVGSRDSSFRWNDKGWGVLCRDGFPTRPIRR